LEALLDIRVVPRPDAKVEDLAALDAEFLADYPDRKEKRKASFELAINIKDGKVGPQAVASSHPQGFMYSDREQKNRVQVALDGFTQNVLAPYADFESLLTRARTNWTAFARAVKPRSISRIAVRYINKLHLPVTENIERNLLTFPVIPSAVPQLVSDFAIRMTLHKQSIAAHAIVNQVSQGNVDDEGLQVFLDIDAVIERQIDVDDPTIWDKFEALRAYKNDIFFSFVSPSLMEKYR
jgi:uncharacterized protein (TIGR04255 family)